MNRNLGEWLVLSTALILIGIVLLIAHRTEANRVESSERERLRVITDFVASDIMRSLTTINYVMGGVIKDYLTEPSTPASSHFLTLRLKALQGAIPGVRALLVINARGTITHTTNPELTNRDVSYRSYFKNVRDRPGAASLYISAPFQSFRPEPDLVVAASREVSDGAGGFNGLVVAVLDRTYFSTPFSGGLYAPDVWAIVVHGDGKQIINFPAKMPGIDGTDLNRKGTFFQRHISSGTSETILSGRVYTTGEYRLMNLRTIFSPELGMDKAVVIGLSREISAISLPLKRNAFILGFVFLALASVGGVLLRWRQSHRAKVEAANAALEDDRRKVEHDIRQNKAELDSERRFRTLIEDAPLAIAILRGGLFIYTNPRYRDLHGYAYDDDLTNVPWHTMITMQSRATLIQQEALIIADSPIEQRFETVGLGKGGVLVPIFKTTTRVDLIDGAATLVLAQDISLQKNAEHALIHARDVAEAASRSKADFLANMSHEIRSPLNAILGFTYLLERASLNFDAHEMVGKIQASGRILLAIINDILDLSKIESGHMVIEESIFRLSDVIDNVAATMGVAVAEKDIQLVVHPCPVDTSSLLGDSLRLEQILSNLTGNAIKFTNVGQVALRVSLVSREAGNVVLRFSVTDTGIGIDPALQEEIFSAFTQADTSITRRFGGSGLGLSICRRLVDLMGGQMGVTSELNSGSEFWVTLTFKLVDEGSPLQSNMAGLAALVADDSEVALKVIGDIGNGLGWKVNTVTSGDAALAWVMEARSAGAIPDVIILDWQMPGMDGISTARAIRETLTVQECPIVIMATTYSLPALGQQAGAELADAILSKPVTASALFNATITARFKRATHLAPSGYLSNNVLGGVRVLVVDDSEINRDVAQRILLAHGAQVTLACDGLEAFNWLVARPDDVDVVLMDVQMPNMDGLEATRKLRQLPEFDDLPIIALTAGAFRSQQEAALAAGMTHFVSKPINVRSTVALIQKIRRGSNAEAPAARDDHDQHALAGASPYGSSVIDIRRGLEIWADIDTYRIYLRRFANAYGDAADVINDHLAAGDHLTASALVHKLAGAAAHLGLADVHRVAMQVERMLLNEIDASVVLARLRSALAEALLAIDRFVPPVNMHASEDGSQHDGVAALPDGMRDTVQSLFDALLEALDTDNPAPVRPVLIELSKYIPQQQLASIHKLVDAFDFRGAESASRVVAINFGITI